MSETVVVGGASGQLGARLLPHLTLTHGWHVLAWDTRAQRGTWHPAGGSPARTGLSQEDALGSLSGAPLRGVVALSGQYESAPFLGQSRAREVELFAANYFSVTELLRAWIPPLTRQGAGAFITISTRGAVEPYAGAGTYLAAKSALKTLTEALAMELSGDGVRGHCLVCGPLTDGPTSGEAVAYSDVAECIGRLLAAPGSTVDYLPPLKE